MTSKAEILKTLKPCVVCGNTLPIVRETVDFKKGTTSSIYQIVCPHKGQRPPLFFDLKTKWSSDPVELANRWNAL